MGENGGNRCCMQAFLISEKVSNRLLKIIRKKEDNDESADHSKDLSITESSSGSGTTTASGCSESISTTTFSLFQNDNHNNNFEIIHSSRTPYSSILNDGNVSHTFYDLTTPYSSIENYGNGAESLHGSTSSSSIENDSNGPDIFHASTSPYSSIGNDNNNHIAEIVNAFEVFLCHVRSDFNGRKIQEIIELFQPTVRAIFQMPPTCDVFTGDESPKRWFGPLASEIWQDTEEFQYSFMNHVINYKAGNPINNEQFVENPLIDSLCQQSADNESSHNMDLEQTKEAYSFKLLDSEVHSEESDDNESYEQETENRVTSQKKNNLSSIEKFKDGPSKIETDATTKKSYAQCCKVTTNWTGDPPEPGTSSD